jgi:hypothetical protein
MGRRSATRRLRVRLAWQFEEMDPLQIREEYTDDPSGAFITKEV